MAHSKIYQFSLTPLSEDDYMGESRFYEDDTFVGEVADYVSDEVDRNECLLDLEDELGQSFVEWRANDQVVFLSGFKRAYFEHSFKAFKKLSEETTMELFLDGMHIFKLKILLESKFGTYIYLESHGEWMNIGQFIREHLKENEVYYIGNVIDYHY